MMIYVYCNDNSFNLNNLLLSIKENKVDMNFLFLISALTEESKEAFDMVIKHHKIDNFLFLSNPIQPKEELVNLIKECQEDVIGFMTSEDMFYSWDDSISVTQSIKGAFDGDQQLFSISLRLGKNINYNSIFKSKAILIPLEETSDLVFWDWDKHYLDFSAPLSTHGNFFRKKEILKMIRASSFYDFDSLEDSLQIYNNFPKKKMGAFLSSKIVSLLPELDHRKAEAIKRSETKIILSGDLSKTIAMPPEVREQFIQLNINGLEK